MSTKTNPLGSLQDSLIEDVRKSRTAGFDRDETPTVVTTGNPLLEYKQDFTIADYVPGFLDAGEWYLGTRLDPPRLKRKVKYDDSLPEEIGMHVNDPVSMDRILISDTMERGPLKVDMEVFTLIDPGMDYDGPGTGMSWVIDPAVDDDMDDVSMQMQCQVQGACIEVAYLPEDTVSDLMELVLTMATRGRADRKRWTLEMDIADAAGDLIIFEQCMDRWTL